MPQFHGFLQLMDQRSFASIWFWLVLVGAWSASGRTVLGVPVDIIARARRAPGDEPGLLLLDWLSLTLPRWRIAPPEGAALLALVAFVGSSLAILGFAYGLEFAQALVVLGAPFLVLLVMRLRLARRLDVVLDAARRGDTPPSVAVGEALARITTHRRLAAGLSLVAVAATALWGTRHVLLNNPLAF